MLFKFIFASFYDLLVIVALLMLTTAVCLISTHQTSIAAGTRWYQFLLLAIMIAYYLVCLKFGGQTIGLKAWQLQLVTSKERLTLLQAFFWLCLAAPALGLGLITFKSPQYFLFKWTKIKIIKVGNSITEKP